MSQVGTFSVSWDGENSVQFLLLFRVAKCVQQMQRPGDDRAVPIWCYVKTHSSIRFDWAISGARLRKCDYAIIDRKRRRRQRAQMKRIYRKIGYLVHLQRHFRFGLTILCVCSDLFLLHFVFCRLSTVLILLAVLAMLSEIARME